jgi:predicted NAD/FAD-dependent oxidoreductase
VTSAVRAIAIIGAGVAGAAAARALADDDFTVTVFDKGRAPGGRASTRRQDDHAFDHGAQYFTARDPRFIERVNQWRRRGAAAPWRARFVNIRPGAITERADEELRFVGVPQMSTICSDLLRAVNVQSGARVVAIEGEPGHWRLRLENGASTEAFARVICTAPPNQAASLVGPVAPRLAGAARKTKMLPCWALMAAFEEPIERQFDAARLDHPVLAWVARDASKPGRAPAARWVAHASREWSESNVDLSRDDAAAALLDAFADVMQCHNPPALAVAHRWRYAFVEDPVGSPCLADNSETIFLAGDWLLGPRIECAYLSGLETARQIITRSALQTEAS